MWKTWNMYVAIKLSLRTKKVNAEKVEADIAEEEEGNLTSKYDSFERTSETLVEGKWDDIISNTAKGENKSPQLSW